MDPTDDVEFLRAENALLRVERDILLRVAAGFADDANATLLRRRTPHRKRDNAMDTVWLTEAAYARLSDELAALRTSAAPDDEDPVAGLLRRQARARELEDLLRRAVVGQPPPDDGVAEPGMVLTVRFDDETTTETFLLGARDGAADGLEVYSADSPLGRALTGARQGESRSYTVPSGATVRVTLVSAVPYGQHAVA
ncbi:transcription elongation GreA/GreB family factor [Amycolatopsis endophytica]|uniref:Transcription elongation GreA/GreB family factor n=1 Tax=Amycolatopsis endophytica TaxID=860233 RepID=A0A853BEF5_9PSEU|nr:GreA/GreB family elongation factor [Amycolatopsis endophytica]NYI93155.1 transcription elongation GreA/GreB family factor [Amycolatopsis endophytica]